MCVCVCVCGKELFVVKIAYHIQTQNVQGGEKKNKNIMNAAQ